MKRNFAASRLCSRASSLALLPTETTAQRRRAARVACPTPAPRVTPSVNARFNQLSDAYLRGYYAFNPTEATALGLMNMMLNSNRAAALGRAGN